METICDKQQCTGCGACWQSCPKQCIAMTGDAEGFLRPEIDEERCIDCGVCRKVCPALHRIKREDFSKRAYAVQGKDQELLSRSSSGGVAGTITRRILQDGGVVYGCAFDNRMTARHIRLDSPEESDPAVWFQIRAERHRGIFYTDEKRFENRKKRSLFWNALPDCRLVWISSRYSSSESFDGGAYLPWRSQSGAFFRLSCLEREAAEGTDYRFHFSGKVPLWLEYRLLTED